MGVEPWMQNPARPWAKHYHVLGVIILDWNSCNDSLLRGLTTLSGLSEGGCRAFVRGLDDIAIVNRVHAFLESRDCPADYRASVRHALEAYEICRFNRNGAIDSDIFFDQDLKSLAAREEITRANDPVTTALESLRRVADDIRRLDRYLQALSRCRPDEQTGRLPSPDALPSPLPLIPRGPGRHFSLNPASSVVMFARPSHAPSAAAFSC